MTLALFNPVGFAAHQNGIAVGTHEKNQLCANSGHNERFNGHAGQSTAVRSGNGECLLVQRPLVFFRLVLFPRPPCHAKSCSM